MADPQNAPMGRLDAFDVAAKKLTIQTEFFSRPAWRIETHFERRGLRLGHGVWDFVHERT